MNGFLRRILNLDTLELAVLVAHQQKLLIDELSAEISRLKLEHARSSRDLLEAFLTTHERGVDVRDELLAGLSDLQDEVARQEEHASS